MEKKRIDYMDMAKGIGIILVVIGHSTFASDQLLTWLASFHMPLFFVISGMLIWHIGEEKKPMKTIILRKCKSIMLPYVSFSVIYMIVKFLYLIRMPELITIQDIQRAAVDSLSFYGISVLWFLPALFVGETLFLATRKKCSHTVTVLLAVVFAMIAVLGKPLLESNLLIDANLGNAWLGGFAKMILRSFTAYAFLTLGYYTKRYLLKDHEGIKWQEILLSVMLFAVNAFLAFTNIRVDMNFLVFGNPFFYFLAAYSGSMAVVLLCKNLKTIKPLVFLGVNSLVIMATHVECQIMMIAIRISSWVAALFETGQMLILYIGLAITLTIMEIITIYVFNHYFYFLIGKKKSTSKSISKSININISKGRGTL